MLTRIYNKIKRNGANISCVFVGNNLKRVSVTTDKDLIAKTPVENIVGFYNYDVQDWMLEEDLEYFGVKYETV